MWVFTVPMLKYSCWAISVLDRPWAMRQRISRSRSVRPSSERGPGRTASPQRTTTSDVRWFTPGELEDLDIHPAQWRQLRDWLDETRPRID